MKSNKIQTKEVICDICNKPFSVIKSDDDYGYGPEYYYQNMLLPTGESPVIKYEFSKKLCKTCRITMNQAIADKLTELGFVTQDYSTLDRALSAVFSEVSKDGWEVNESK